ncbi:MAG: hypothetical protein PHX70_08690 [Clostridium sp.]|nr:hypothetical protein [Clostridium sp.]
MAKKKFTEEEMNHLRASNYVLDVSSTIVRFSAQFKKIFWDTFITGQKPRDIVMNFGIDPDILGDVRIGGLKSMIRNEVKAGNGFRDLETYQGTINGFMTPEAKIKILEQQLAYKDQEISFLKKLHL